jgi:hypothetical protein
MASPIGVTICRSDGVSTYVSNDLTIVNGPKVEPDANGRVYQKLGADDAKEYDWRKKLGTALMKHLRDLEPERIEKGNRSCNLTVQIVANDIRQRVCFEKFARRLYLMGSLCT